MYKYNFYSEVCFLENFRGPLDFSDGNSLENMNEMKKSICDYWLPLKTPVFVVLVKCLPIPRY